MRCLHVKCSCGICCFAAHAGDNAQENGVEYNITGVENGDAQEDSVLIHQDDEGPSDFGECLFQFASHCLPTKRLTASLH